VDRLVHTAGLDRDQVLAMTSEQAVDAWTEHITRRS
jgi:mRNA interferase RelE/StbE